LRQVGALKRISLLTIIFTQWMFHSAERPIPRLPTASTRLKAYENADAAGKTKRRAFERKPIAAVVNVREQERK
jgi:hypothetical protein